jgi:CubicO group peptidase (beta-lactamase class C family)
MVGSKILGAALLVLASVSIARSAPAALTADDLNAWLDGYLPYALHSNDIAGAVVAVVKDGQIVTERGFG